MGKHPPAYRVATHCPTCGLTVVSAKRGMGAMARTCARCGSHNVACADGPTTTACYRALMALVGEIGGDPTQVRRAWGEAVKRCVTRMATDQRRQRTDTAIRAKTASGTRLSRREQWEQAYRQSWDRRGGVRTYEAPPVRVWRDDAPPSALTEAQADEVAGLSDPRARSAKLAEYLAASVSPSTFPP